MQNLIFTLLFPCVFLGIGLVLILYSLHLRNKAMLAKRWPIAKAQLTDIELDECAGQDGDGQEVLVRYTYQVRGKSYEGQTISFGYGSTSSSDYHRRIYDLLKDRQTLRIYYNPRNPHESVISPQAGNQVSVGIAMGLIFTLWSLGMFILALFHPSPFLVTATVVLMVVAFFGGFIFISYPVDLRKGDPLIRSLYRARK